MKQLLVIVLISFSSLMAFSQDLEVTDGAAESTALESEDNRIVVKVEAWNSQSMYDVVAAFGEQLNFKPPRDANFVYLQSMLEQKAKTGQNIDIIVYGCGSLELTLGEEAVHDFLSLLKEAESKDSRISVLYWR